MNPTNQTALLDFVTRLGDNSLIAGHRLSEWCSNAPYLEEDIAMTNMALDFVGASRILLTYAGEVEGKGRTEDDFAFVRKNEEFRNALLLEQPNGDFAVTTAKQFFYATFNYLLFSELQKVKMKHLRALQQKHLRKLATTYVTRMNGFYV